MSGVAKNKVVLLIVVAMLVCSVGQAWSKGTPGVKNTIHNLSTSAPYITYRAGNEDEICVFCHTPHGGTLEGPLWNHALPDNEVNDFTHYNSASLSTYLRGLSAARIINDESLICMSCHDGSIAVDHLINFSNDHPDITYTVFDPNTRFIVDLFGYPGGRIGGLNRPGLSGAVGRLDDDHPISFSYTEVLKSPEYQLNGSKENELRLVADAETYNGEGVRFFGTDKRVECSSCHDPHVDYDVVASPSTAQPEYKPFLIRPNTGSELCLSCHNK